MGRYNPKIYNRDWLKIIKEDFSEQLEGGHIIADMHYETANCTFNLIRAENKVVFYTPIAKPCGRKRKRSDELPEDQTCGATQLTHEQDSWNACISHVQA